MRAVVALALLSLAGPASAQVLMCFEKGAGCKPAIGIDPAVSNDLVNRIIPDGTVTITATPQPQCDTGWALLTYPGTNLPVCAKDLKPPK